MNSLCTLNSVTNITKVVSSQQVYSGNVYGVANCIILLDAKDSANLSLDGSNRVIYWRSGSGYASNVYYKTGIATANAFPIYVADSYPYVSFPNTTNTLSSASYGMAANASFYGMTPYSMGLSVYFVATCTANYTYNNMMRLQSLGSPSIFFLAQAWNTSSETLVGAAYAEKDYRLSYAAANNLPLNVKNLACYTVSFSNGSYYYANNVLKSSNTQTATALYSNAIFFNGAYSTLAAAVDNRNWAGRINEVIVYNTYHTASQRNAVSANLVVKWNVQNVYPAGGTWTVSGSANISNVQYISNMMSTSSLYLPGTYTNRAVMTNFPSTNLASTSWTIEWFVFLPTGWTGPQSTEGSPICIANTGIYYRIYPAFNGGNKRIFWYLQNSAGSYLFQGIPSSSQYTENAWNHCAVTFNSSNNNYQLFQNGTYANNQTQYNSVISPNFGSELTRWAYGVLSINGTETNMGGGGCYVDAVRVSSNVRYSSDTYTIPTTYYPVDDKTMYLNFFEGANSTVSMSNAEYYLP